MKLFRSLLLGLGALALLAVAAHAVIDGNNTASQRQRLYMGEVVPGYGTATQTSQGQALTVNNGAGILNLTTLTLTANGVTTINLSNNRVRAGDMLLVTLDSNTNSTGIPIISDAKINGSGSILINIRNLSGSAALNGALRIYFLLLRQGNSN